MFFELLESVISHSINKAINATDNVQKNIASLVSIFFSGHVLILIALFREESSSFIFIITAFLFGLAFVSNLVFLVIPIIFEIPSTPGKWGWTVLSGDKENNNILIMVNHFNNYLWIFSIIIVILGILSLIFCISLTLGILFILLISIPIFLFFKVVGSKNERLRDILNYLNRADL